MVLFVGFLMRSFHLLVAAAASIAAILFALSGAMLSYEVVARYFFSKPTVWAAELSQLCLIWGSLLGMSWLLAQQRHIRVDAVAVLLPERLRRCLDALAMAVVALFAVIVAVWGFDIFLDSFSRGRTTGSLLNLPSWVAELSVPVGFVLLFFQALLEIPRAWQGAHSQAAVHDI